MAWVWLWARILEAGQFLENYYFLRIGEAGIKDVNSFLGVFSVSSGYLFEQQALSHKWWMLVNCDKRIIINASARCFIRKNGIIQANHKVTCHHKKPTIHPDIFIESTVLSDTGY